MLTTLAQAHGGPDASYYGDNGDWVIAIAKTRDADALERSNFDAALDLMRDYGPGTINRVSPNDWAVETSGHWAVGHIDYLVVRPGTQAYINAQCIEASLEGYPVLDDELYAEYEDGERQDLWDVMGRPDMRERIQYLAQHGDSIFAARCKDAYQLYERAESTYYALSE